MVTKTAKKTASVKASKKTVAVKKKSTIKKAAKTTTKTAARKKPTAKKTAKQSIKKQNTKFIVSHEQRHHMISEAAYFISLKSDHAISDPIYNWFEAEYSIDLICECEYRTS